jgi:hypothetical protein
MKYSPTNVTSLEPNQIFVFGSNLAGRHGKGAAKQAVKWGAKYGVGSGRMGQTYGIPTKDRRLSILSLQSIEGYILEFIKYARENPNMEFLVTKIGCGLALYRPEDIAPLFLSNKPPDNVILPKEFYI